MEDDNVDRRHELVVSLQKFQRRYFEEVEKLFSQNSESKANLAFSRWEKSFIEFLDLELPGSSVEYRDHKNKNRKSECSIWSVATLLDNWNLSTGNAVKSFLDLTISDVENGGILTTEKKQVIPKNIPNNSFFIDPSRIEELKIIKHSEFDLTKLIRLCEELNICYSNGCYIATLILIRTILDHIPPIFRESNFCAVANNYTGGKSFKQIALKLETTSRSLADSILHLQINKKETLPTKIQVDFTQEMDFLLETIIKLVGK